MPGAVPRRGPALRRRPQRRQGLRCLVALRGTQFWFFPVPPGRQRRLRALQVRPLDRRRPRSVRRTPRRPDRPFARCTARRRPRRDASVLHVAARATESARAPASKAVVLIRPANRVGEIVWPYSRVEGHHVCYSLRRTFDVGCHQDTDSSARKDASCDAGAASAVTPDELRLGELAWCPRLQAKFAARAVPRTPSLGSASAGGAGSTAFQPRTPHRTAYRSG